MPLYQFQCKRCGDTVEIHLAVKHRNNITEHACADGETGELKRKFSSPGFQIEGRAYLYPGGTDWTGEAGLSRGDI